MIVAPGAVKMERRIVFILCFCGRQLQV